MATPAGRLDAHRFSGRVIAWWVVRALFLVAVGVAVDEAATVPYLYVGRRDMQRVGHLLHRQRASVPQTVIARLWGV